MIRHAATSGRHIDVKIMVAADDKMSAVSSAQDDSHYSRRDVVLLRQVVYINNDQLTLNISPKMLICKLQNEIKLCYRLHYKIYYNIQFPIIIIKTTLT